MPLDLRPITAAEVPAFLRAEGVAFGRQPDDAEIAMLATVVEPERTIAAFDGDQIVGTAAVRSFELTLPGLTIAPIGGVTFVGVTPTHRRQGILTAMMRRLLAAIRERGEAIAALNASESLIYGRFGYGLATSMLGVELDRRHSAFAQPLATLGATGRIRLIEHERALEAFVALDDEARRQRPGALNRPRGWWEIDLRDPTKTLDSFGARFYAAYENGDGALEGVVAYRIKQEWQTAIPHGTLWLNQLVATTPAARAALWRHCCDVDLVQTVRAFGVPLDEPLRWLLADPRQMRATALLDDLWVRLLDLPAALAARRYAVAGRLVFDVRDAFCPENTGRYALEGGPDGATCRRVTTGRADLALEVADLGAAYLGGVSFATLAQVGRVEERAPGALRRADALFATDRPPFSGVGF
ncbi:MAG TPA: GNAT family N-acetyltransferase [Ktedonobacterales bacterium]|jgi:predicted acetyltransferase